MTAKMDRRTFLKTTAAAVVAVSMSGMLTGCGESEPENAVKITLGEYEVSMTPKVAISGSETGGAGAGAEGTYLFVPGVTIRYNGNATIVSVPFKNVFSAKLGAEEAKLKNGNSMIAAVDLPFGKSKTYAPQFGFTPDAYKAYKNEGGTLKVTVTLQGQSAVFSLTHAGSCTVAKV